MAATSDTEAVAKPDTLNPGKVTAITLLTGGGGGPTVPLAAHRNEGRVIFATPVMGCGRGLTRRDFLLGFSRKLFSSTPSNATKAKGVEPF